MSRLSLKPSSWSVLLSQRPLNSSGVVKTQCHLLTRSTDLPPPRKGHIRHEGSREGVPHGNGTYRSWDPNLLGVIDATRVSGSVEDNVDPDFDRSHCSDSCFQACCCCQDILHVQPALFLGAAEWSCGVGKYSAA